MPSDAQRLAAWLGPYATMRHDARRPAGGWSQEYEDSLIDDALSAALAQRRSAVVARPTRIERVSDRAADRVAEEVVAELIDRVDWDTVCDQALWAVYWGWALLEVVWAREGRRWKIADLVAHPIRHWRLKDGIPHFGLKSTPPPDRLVAAIVRPGPHAGHDQGYGIAQFVRPLVERRALAAHYWAVYSERHAAPTAVGRYPAGTTDLQRDRILEVLGKISTEAVLALPADVEVSLLETGRQHTSYEAYSRYLDERIALAVLGQSMTSLDGSSRSQAEVHERVRRDIVQADADLLSDQFRRTFLAWAVEEADPAGRVPLVYRDLEDPIDLTVAAQRDEILARIGYRPTPERVTEVYGEGYAHVAPAVASPPTLVARAPTARLAAAMPPRAAELATGRPPSPTELLEADWLRRVHPAVQRALARAEEVVDRATDLRELREALLDAELVDRSAAAEAIRGAGAIATMAGVLDAARESDRPPEVSTPRPPGSSSE